MAIKFYFVTSFANRNHMGPILVDSDPGFREQNCPRKVIWINPAQFAIKGLTK